LSDGIDEIYAYGLRNPYRFSFDQLNGDLYAGDVGQGDIEEINLIQTGGNYGWNQKEGSFFFYPNDSQSGYVSNQAPNDLTADLIDPILQYDHDEGISVTGGYVYRGSAIAPLNGAYIFADWSSDFAAPLGRLFYSKDQSTIEQFQLSDQQNVGLFVTGFGQDHQGEVYVLGNTTGTPTAETGVLQKIIPAEQEICFPIKDSQQRVNIVCF